MKKDKVIQYISATIWGVSFLAMYCVVSAYCSDEISDKQAVYLGILTVSICVGSCISTLKEMQPWK